MESHTVGLRAVFSHLEIWTRCEFFQGVCNAGDCLFQRTDVGLRGGEGGGVNVCNAGDCLFQRTDDVGLGGRGRG